ncbi:hypothetical protein NX722_23450 [Endozoicomonas gorgoniicola]|uniref:Toxin-activating lysine-acyltransferase n=1 Tax=Endozoicomonas gorgoniicola TaxID=1234144 RepID=A0ABT3N2G1_9GAMM|nr:hypothetical protein [Endozoicomonas gorgoniicola]MCW7555523.1 hypothetical protein [Endozoicomonas gorgoniicola]
MDRVSELVELMINKPSSSYAGFDHLTLDALIRHNWNTGQWVILTGSDNELYGWLGWMALDDKSLEVIKEDGLIQCIRSEFILWPGNHIYYTHCITSPDAPRNTYRRLRILAEARNPEAQSFNAHLINRRGRVRWYSREGKHHGNQPGRR